MYHEYVKRIAKRTAASHHHFCNCLSAHSSQLYEHISPYEYPTKDNAKPSGDLVIFHGDEKEGTLTSLPSWLVPVVVAVLAMGGAITTAVYRKVRDVANLISKLQIEEGEEVVLDLDQTLKARCKFDRNEQYAWGTTELIDMFFDMLSLSYLFLEDFNAKEGKIVR